MRLNITRSTTVPPPRSGSTVVVVGSSRLSTACCERQLLPRETVPHLPPRNTFAMVRTVACREDPSCKTAVKLSTSSRAVTHGLNEKRYARAHRNGTFRFACQTKTNRIENVDLFSNAPPSQRIRGAVRRRYAITERRVHAHCWVFCSPAVGHVSTNFTDLVAYACMSEASVEHTDTKGDADDLNKGDQHA